MTGFIDLPPHAWRAEDMLDRKAAGDELEAERARLESEYDGAVQDMRALGARLKSERDTLNALNDRASQIVENINTLNDALDGASARSAAVIGERLEAELEALAATHEGIEQASAGAEAILQALEAGFRTQSDLYRRISEVEDAIAALANEGEGGSYL